MFRSHLVITMRLNSYSIQEMQVTPLDNPVDNMDAQAVKTKHKLAVLRKIIPMRINECKKIAAQHIFKQTIYLLT